jgi:mannose-1-phosphate guanylyltransferase
VLPSDHHIENEDAFRAVLTKALAASEAGNLVTVGIVPTRPETGYGYIELGEAIGEGGGADVRKVARFVEKPDIARAREYVAGKKHLWNAGMFIFRAGDMLAAIDRALPELGEGIRAIQAGGDEALARVFPTLPSISIDHGVMEKTANLAVVPGEFGWNDVGSWESAWELAKKDDAGNALPTADGQIAVAVDARGNLVQTSDPKKTVALLGVEGLVVVDTGDALLIMPRDRAQDVRAIVDALKKKGGPV